MRRLSLKPGSTHCAAALCVALIALATLAGCASNATIKPQGTGNIGRGAETGDARSVVDGAAELAQPSFEEAAGKAETTPPPAAAGDAETGLPSPARTTPMPSHRAVAPASTRVLERFAKQLAAQNCSRPATVQRIEVIKRQRQAIERKFQRVLPLLDYVLAAMENAGLPGQFALIPWAESGFRADPGNRGGVQGLWQFTTSTGKAHGLRIDNQYDGRRAAIESTAAAVDHLKTLMQQFGDWRLAALAYNAGPNRVARGLRGQPTDRERVPTGLAPHSIAYLNRIAALSCVLAAPERFSTDLLQMDFEPLVVTRRPAFASSTALISRAAGIELHALLDYNAGFRRGDVADDAPSRLLLPVSAAARLDQATVTNAARHRNPPPAPPSRTQPTYVVSVGDTLWQIARRYGVALSDLLRWNKIGSSKVIRPGDVLRLVPLPPPES